ncbi:MAG: FkbM family methyltransferase [Kouleothrix sp.]|nr:FkbM family methyltransferase [Kouleothrix sp.]
MYKRRALLKRFIFIRRPVPIRLARFTIYVRLDDWAVGARIAVKRSYEPHVSRAIDALLRPGMVVVDVGANIGYYTLLAATRVGPAGKVIAFEPGESSCDLLRMSLRANRLDNVQLHAYAVADAAGTVGFGMDDSNGRISRDDPLRSPYQVPAVALDSFLKDEPRVDLIKMDIEGAEGRALRGMRDLVRRHRPTIFSELSPRGLEVASGLTAPAYMDQLRGLGYDLHLLRRGGAAEGPLTNEQLLSAISGGADHIDLMGRPSST